MNYPDISGIRLDLSIKEVNQIMKDLDYGLLKFIVSDSSIIGGDLYKVYRDGLSAIDFVFDNDALSKFEIRNWREFFSFTTDDMGFNNLNDVFFTYFLKGYKYKKTIDGRVTLNSPYSGKINCNLKMNRYDNENWRIYFYYRTESIMMTKVK